MFSVIVVFSLSALWWRRIGVLWNLLDGKHWVRRKLGLVLMGRAMLNKSSIQFFVDGQGCLPLCYVTWSQTMVEVIKIMATSFKRSHSLTATLSAPNPAAGHSWPMPLPKTPGPSWATLGSLSWGHCSFLLGPGAHKVLFVPSKSLLPQSCVSSGSSMVGL